METMVDALDRQILGLLQSNARISFADIGRTVGLSSSAVRERVQKMEDNGTLQGYQAVINHQHLGQGLAAFILVKAYHGQFKHLMDNIKNFPEINKAYRVTGEQNLHLTVHVSDQLGLQNLIDRLMCYGHTQTQLILSELPTSNSSLPL